MSTSTTTAKEHSEKRSGEHYVSLLVSPREEKELKAKGVKTLKEYIDYVREDGFESGLVQAGARFEKQRIINRVIIAERRQKRSDDDIMDLLQEVLAVDRMEAELILHDYDHNMQGPDCLPAIGRRDSA